MADAVSLTREWLEAARADADVAERSLAPGPPHHALSAFHFQQSAEKLLKAFLTYHGRPFEKTHEISRLCQRCAEVDSSFADLIDVADRLTTYAVDMRYPGVEPPTLDDIVGARATVNEVRNLVYDRLPTEVTRGY